jgi:hypothetical protein
MLALAGASLLALGGCIPEESPIAPYDRGPVRSETFALGQNYSTQIYFDLATGSVIFTNPITSWDLGFRSDPGGYQILLNSGVVAGAFDVGAVPFESVTSSGGAQWRNDRPGGEWDSTAIGAWWQGDGDAVSSRGHVYLIDRGYDTLGRRRGYAKLMVLGADAHGFRIRFAKLDGTDDHTATIERDTARNVTGFSFEQGGAPVAIEPPKGSWDIVFTRYTHVFYDPGYTPYGVTGVLLNRSLTTAAIDSIDDFDAITAADTSRLLFTPALNTIGYEWKTYDLATGNYTVNTRRIFIVRRRNGFTFRLRFVEFYNDHGERGYPRMEWRVL